MYLFKQKLDQSLEVQQKCLFYSFSFESLPNIFFEAILHHKNYMFSIYMRNTLNMTSLKTLLN